MPFDGEKCRLINQNIVWLGLWYQLVIKCVKMDNKVMSRIV